MAKKEGFDAIIANNRSQQKRARELNARCGENLFQVYSQTELQSYIMEQLAGARCVREVADVEKMRLPMLDEEIAALVLAENPEKIMVLGEELAVEYRGVGYAPLVRIRNILEGNRWQQLPDEGIKLSGGRIVEVVISHGIRTIDGGKDVPALKKKVREYLNEQQWSSWVKPVLPLPDLAKDKEFPEMAEVQYGTCVITGIPLMAYGALIPKSYRSYASDPYFEARWYQIREEAERAHTAAATTFVEARTRALQASKLDQVKMDAGALQREIMELYRDSRSYDVGDMRGELYNYAFAHFSSDITGLEAWQTKAERLIARVESAFVELECKKQEREKARERLQQLLEKEYAACPLCNTPWESRHGTTCWCIEYEKFDDAETLFCESVAVDDRVLVRVKLAYSARRNPVPYVSLNVVDELIPDLSEVTTRTLWTPPSDEERELYGELRSAEGKLDDLDRELDKCGGDYFSRVQLKFEVDGERGTLFAIANVRELSVQDWKSGDYNSISGAVRFVCDPKRCQWIDVPPANGQTWVCSAGKMISRDRKGRPVIGANPQIRVDGAREAIEAEIAEITAKIAALRGEAISVGDAADEHHNDDVPQGAVTTDMLAALRVKFSN